MTHGRFADVAAAHGTKGGDVGGGGGGAATTVEDRGSQRRRLGHEVARDGGGGPGGGLLVEYPLLTGQVKMAARGGCGGRGWPGPAGGVGAPAAPSLEAARTQRPQMWRAGCRGLGPRHRLEETSRQRRPSRPAPPKPLVTLSGKLRLRGKAPCPNPGAADFPTRHLSPTTSCLC